MTSKVAITDYTFDAVDVEKGILEPLGCQVVAQKSGKDCQQLAALVADADYVITQFAPVDATIIGGMQKCRVIVRYGIGVDNVDLRAAAAKSIPVCNVPDYCIQEVADHTLAMVLDLTRRITQNANKVRTGTWGSAVTLQEYRSLSNMTVGVVGFGRIGREVANRLKPFQCKTLVFDPAVDAAAVRTAGFEPTALDELMAASDLVTLHCPSTDDTRQMINAASIARMKDGAMIVNASRGTLVKTGDLVAALKSGKLSGAALDVTDPEPINSDSPLLTMDNVLINPHVASASPQAVHRLRTTAAGIVALAVQGKKLPNIVNGVKS